MISSWGLFEALSISLFLAPASPSRPPAPSVNVGLQASFPKPPFLLELLETAAQENASSYFPLLDRIAEGRFVELATEKHIYDTFITTLQEDGHITDPDVLSSFNFALSIHAAAPRIQAHYQYYNTSIEPLLMIAQDAACPTWAHVDGKQYCSPTLERAQQDFEGPETSGELPFDRVWSLDPGLPVSTLYADVNSPLFAHFHQTLRESVLAGKGSYRVRYRRSLAVAESPLLVSGYGVSLALKRTDYIVIDDRGTESDETQPADTAPAKPLSFESEDVDDLKPLSASELLGLGIKTSSYILGHPEPLDTLERISQDFPKHSAAISKLNYTAEFMDEHSSNRELYLGAGINVIWINGLQVDSRQMDAFSLVDRLRHERNLIKSFRSIGFSAPEAISIFSHIAVAQSKSSGEVHRYDYRDALEGGRAIIWLNDIEKDKRYDEWPSESSALVQRLFPGQLPAIRRDVHNLVVPLDFSDPKDLEFVLETLQMFVKRLLPIRVGIIPILKSQESERQAKAIYYINDRYGLSAVMSYISISAAGKKDSCPFDRSKFDLITKEISLKDNRVALDAKSMLEGDEFTSRVTSAKAYLRRLGLDGTTVPVLVNGAIVPKNDALMQSMSERVSADISTLQQKFFEEGLSDDQWLAGIFLEGAAAYRNPLIIPEDESNVNVINLAEIGTKYREELAQLPHIPSSDDSVQQFLTHLIIVVDVDSDEGLKLLKEALNFRKQQNETDLVMLHSGAPSDTAKSKSTKLFDFLSMGSNLDLQELEAALDSRDSFSKEQSDNVQKASAFWERMQPIVTALGLKRGESAVMLNGRLIGSIPKGAGFSHDDFSNLLSYERSKRIAPVNTALSSLDLESHINSAFDVACITSLVALSAKPDVPEGIFDTASNVRMNAFQAWNSQHSAISIGDNATASVQIVASIDPTSEIAQRWIPILNTLSKLHGVSLKLFLNPRERMQELPVKRFYRHVLQPRLSFREDGRAKDPTANFEGLPRKALLSLAMDVPPAWLVSPKECVQDLDNIKLSVLKPGMNVDALYELEYILIEGHSRDATNGQPPRGAQLLLGTEMDSHSADTLVMANLGYFQFKANPGYWNIRLKPGRSKEIFKIDSIGANGYSDESPNGLTEVALMSFQGKTLFPKLSRLPGHETADVLNDTPKAGSPQEMVFKATNFLQKTLSSVGLGSKDKEHADINIFSVASGHLYERMLNIMMVSVMRHTKHTVKFWFIEQFLSPSFKETLPFLAEAYRFNYEMVTYKWPHWLRGQKEKQREIWGYKILFLDVLFPLSLDKVIFVDADQIVRTDMYELVTHDLHGAPYGFTPMCDSRVEMEGYRFWKQGYWKNALRGLPYHISALYVVDLKKFRQMAAGDRLRQSYHQLSADPNSLSNLDQDLPNNMQNGLPIHSLPQEWLWCETWCSDESLKDARTIDLCNNPETKEPKLDRARRQVPEWTGYDEEIAEVFKRAKGDVVKGTSVQEELDNQGRNTQDSSEKHEQPAESEKEKEQEPEQVSNPKDEL